MSPLKDAPPTGGPWLPAGVAARAARAIPPPPPRGRRPPPGDAEPIPTPSQRGGRFGARCKEGRVLRNVPVLTQATGSVPRGMSPVPSGDVWLPGAGQAARTRMVARQAPEEQIPTERAPPL